MQPKVAAHCGGCSASGFTCIDCSRPFDRYTVQAHTQCVTEHEKYAQGATKPGGFAAKGFFAEGAAVPPQANTPAGAAEGLQFLSTRAPWVCSVCTVTCTSRETLLGHAQGAKHKRRSKAAQAAATGDQPTAAAGAQAAFPEPIAAAAAAEPEAPAPTNGHKEAAPGQAEPVEVEKGGKAKVPKWKKLAAAQLRKSGGPMKVEKLLAAVLAAAAAPGADAEGVSKKLRGSKQFVFQGKRVRLSAKGVSDK